MTATNPSGRWPGPRWALAGLLALVALVGLAGLASAAHDAGGLHVEASTDNVDVDDCTGACETADGDDVYGSVQAGVDHAAENATIVVAPGTYEESVNVTTPGLELIASDAGQVLLDGERDGENDRRVGVWLQANRTSVVGFSIQDYVIGVGAQKTETIPLTLVTIDRPEDKLSGFRIADNTITFPNRTTPAPDSWALQSVEFNDSEVTSNGVKVWSAEDATIENNTIETPANQGGGKGIRANAVQRSEIRGNDITLHDPPEYFGTGYGITTYSRSNKHVPGRGTGNGPQGVQGRMMAHHDSDVQDCSVPPDRTATLITKRPCVVDRSFDRARQLPEDLHALACMGSEPTQDLALPATGGPLSNVGNGQDLPGLDAALPTQGEDPAIPGPLEDPQAPTAGSHGGALAPLAPLAGPGCQALETAANETKPPNPNEWTNNTIAGNTVTDAEGRSMNQCHRLDPDPCPHPKGNQTDTQGILSGGQRGSVFANNTVTSVDTGIEVLGSTAVTLRDNRVEDATWGLEVTLYSLNFTLRGNEVVDSLRGFQCCWDLNHNEDHGVKFNHDIDRSNTVDGDPIVYLHNASDRVVTGDVATVVAVRSDNITIRDATIENAYEGVFFLYTRDSTVENVTVRNSKFGVKAWGGGTGLRVANSTFTVDRETDLSPAFQMFSVLLVRAHGAEIVNNRVHDVGTGLVPVLSEGVTIADNRITDAHGGIGAPAVGVGLVGGHAVVRNNTVTDSGFGAIPVEFPRQRVVSDHPTGNVFTSNTFADNYAGMWLAASEGETLHDNKMHDNTRNFIARGVHAVDTSNTVDGKPIVYLVGANGAVVDGNVPGVDPGYVGVVDSQGVTVKNLEMSNVFDGVMVYNSKFVRVENVTATDVANGVSLSGARHVTVQDLTTRDAYKGLFVGSAPPGHTAGVGLPNLGLGVTQRVSDSSNVLVADANLTGTFFGIIQVGAERVTVDNATVPEAEFYGFLGVAGRDVTVRDSAFRDTVGTSGLFLGGLGHRAVKNTMTGEGNFSSLLHGYTLDLTVRENTIADAKFGVTGVRSAGTVVEDNSVTDTTFGVLALEDGSETTVANNTVTDSTVGLSSVFSGADTFEDNHATDNRFGFFALGPTPGLTVEENTLVGNENGTWMDTVTSPTEDRGPCVNLFFDITECVTTQEGQARPISVANNTIRENTNHGMVFFTQAELDSIAVRNNTIAGNAGFGVVNRNMTDAVVDARHNYWGASDGPSSPDASNPLEDPFTGEPADGAGDAVSGNATTGVADVRFDPWLQTEPAGTSTTADDDSGGPGEGLFP